MGELCGMSEHLETRAMFAGHDPALNHGAVKPAIQPSSSFVFPDAQSGARFFELAHGATPAADPDETVVTCLVPGKKAEEIATPAGGIEPEVIGRKAAEEGEAEAGKE